MAPGRKRGAKGAKTKSELSLGDLVLAKVKGFPAWPAKISKPEDWERAPDPKKYFVQFFGTEEIAFIAPADIQAFTSESRNKLSARCKGKKVRYFAQAVKEISEEFEELQRKNLSGVRDYSNAENLASERQSIDPALDETSDISVKNGRDNEGPNCNSETKGVSDVDPGLDGSTEILGETDGQTVKSDDMSNNLSPHISSVDRNELSTKSSSLVKETNGDQSALTNGHQPKVTIDSKKKHEGAKRRNSDLVTSRNHNEGGVQIKHASGNSRSDSVIINGRKGKNSLKGKKHSDGEAISEDNNEVISRKKMKLKHDQERQTSRTNGASLPPKIDGIEGKRFVSNGKVEHQPLRAQPSTKESNNSSDEDDLPPTKRQRRALGVMSDSTVKRRAVRFCDGDEDDELPKTPVHVGSTHKVPDIPQVPDSTKKNVKREEAHGNGHKVVRNTGRCRDEFKDSVQPSQISNKALSPTAMQSMESSTLEISAKNVCHVLPQIDTEKTPFVEAKPVAVSLERDPQSIAVTRPLAEPRKKQLSKAPGSIHQKKVPSGTSSSTATVSNRLNSSVNQSATERNNPTSSGEKKKTTPRPDLQTNDSVSLVDNTDESITSHGERLDGGKAINFSVDLTISDSAMSMKNLIAAAQARKRQANLHNSYGNPLRLLSRDADMLGLSPSSASTALAVESRNTLQLDVLGHPSSPSFNVRQLSSISGHENEDLEERRVNSGQQVTGSSLGGDTEAAVARDSFEGMIETLSRTKESIGRATRLAIDCAKYGIANEVVELLIRKLENEPSLHRKVDLFFLVDSITQCSHSQKGIAGVSYIPIVQAALPRLVGAAAPPGVGAQENRRQCRKVLRLWLERKILPESVLRRYMDDLGAINDGLSAGFSQRRPSRAERAIDDPIREMEGMLVDEYGSNTTFQLPGFLSSNLFEDDDEDDDNFPSKLCKEALGVSPSEHTLASNEPENCIVTPTDRRHRILEDVDGELEMEDVSGHNKDERILVGNGTSMASMLEPNSDVKFQSASYMSELLPSPEGSPPLPPGSPPVTPPLPTSPPPCSSPPPPHPPLPSSSPRPLPPPPPSSQKLIPPPPPFPHSLPSQPVSVSRHGPPVPSTSQPLAYHPPPLHHEIGATPSVSQGNPPVHLVSAQGSHTDAPRGEISVQQSSFFSPAAGHNSREHVGYNSSRPVEYRQNDVCINHQASQQRQQLMPSTSPFAPPQQVPNRFSYPNSVVQHQYPPYPLPVFPDGPRRYSTDEQWRMPVNALTADPPYGGWNSGGQSFSGQPYSHEGYFGPPSEWTPSSAINFRPPASNSLPPAAPNPVHGVPMMPCRPDMSAVNWRPG